MILHFDGTPTQEMYERTIKQIACNPLCEDSRLAIEILRKMIKAKIRKQKIRKIWDMK
jgi:hypothetical protein